VKEESQMQKKALAVAAIIALALGALSTGYIFRLTQADSLGMEARCGGTIDKRPSEPFQVEITFRNKGTTEGSWQVVVAFESDGWNWAGQQKELTLEPCEKETLTWEGTVPEEATVGSTARLIVYYNNDFVALNWWIHIVSGAELAIVGSKVS
jgi:hypothetical protein